MIEDLFAIFWDFLDANAEEMGALSIIVAIFYWVRAKSFAIFSIKPKEPVAKVEVEIDQTPKVPMANLTLDQYEERVAQKIAKAEAKLQSAHTKEREELQTQLTELKQRLENPETALAKARETIATLEAALTRDGNEIGETQMAEAREALEAGDFSIADEIFAQIEARETIAVERTARAAFARGEIAQQEVRWHDAAKHYTRAAQIHPTSLNIHKAQIFLENVGDYPGSLYWAEQLIPAVIRDEGAGSPAHAACLNNVASLYHTQGNYDLAEPLYAQAIEIGKNTLGEDHPGYAASLNNLAGLYRAQGKYDLARTLYAQAIEITKNTSGENHPDYAASLNNLAELYREQGKYDLAEPLYTRTIEIDKSTLGEDHPDYAMSLNNLAGLYYAQGKYDLARPLYTQAIAILTKSLGPDHPKSITVQANFEKLRHDIP